VNTFTKIMEEYEEDNEQRAASIENLFIEEAQKLGVVKIS
jgi:hypothetical protein